KLAKKWPPQKDGHSCVGKLFILALEEESARRTKGPQGRAEQHYGRSTIRHSWSTGAAEHIDVRKRPKPARPVRWNEQAGKCSKAAFICGNRVVENVVIVAILQEEPADHLSCAPQVEGDINGILRVRRSVDGDGNGAASN